VLSRQESQDVADGRFLAGRLGQWQVRLDLVARAAAILLLDDVPGCGQAGGVAWALRSVMPRRAATTRGRTPWSRAMHSSTPGVVGEEVPARHPQKFVIKF
jgi:hypothetical protein